MNKKGFTLVELLVVLVVIALLAVVLVPTLLGYIDRAKYQEYQAEAKELLTATQAGIAEAYGKDYESFQNAVRASKCPYVSENYGYYSNNTLWLAQNGSALVPNADPSKENGARAKNIISQSVVKYADSFPYDFYKESLPDSYDVSKLGNKVGFMIMFNGQGAIVYMQYARDGKLVTYDGSSYKVETGDGLKFAKYRN